MELNELYDLAEREGITVDCFDLKFNKCFSVRDGGGNYYIGIDPLALTSHADEKVELAHELGHCETGTFYLRNASALIRSKCEHRANKWAIKKLIPEDELKEACRYCTNRWELAEHFDVTEDFMQMALDYYRAS